MPALPGYPTSWGSSRASVFSVVGLNPYVAYVAPTTGGQLVRIGPSAGVKTIDFVGAAITRDGLYMVAPVHIESAVVNGVALAKAAVRLKWYVVAGGAEVAPGFNLSGSTVDLLVVGPK